VIRLHLDENLAQAVAHGLRLRGFDVTTTPDAHLLRASDETQLAYAVREGRVLVTCDIDFLRTASTGVDHNGILFAEKNRHRHGDIVRGIVSLATRFSSEDLANTVVYLSEILRQDQP
jgi:uncharacterized protein with PIN domain